MSGNFIPIDIVEITTRLDVLIDQGKNSLMNNLIVEFFSNFFSQFLAFASGLLVAYLSKKRERYGIHQKAMVRLEYLLAKHQDRISRLVSTLEGSINILEKGILTYNKFSYLNILESIELELANIHLINDTANYWLSVERVNHDLDSANRMIEVLQQIGVSGIKPHPNNFIHLVAQMGKLKQYLETIFLSENIELNSQVRELLAIDKKTSEITRLTKRYNIDNLQISKRKISSISKKIHNEIKKRSKIDEEKLSKIQYD